VPRTTVRFFRADDGRAPVREWLRDLRERDSRGHEKCTARIRLLEEHGYELRRPLADSLRDGIRELRVRRGNVQYRLLYFFRGRNVAVLACAFQKEEEVPDVEIDRAIERKRLVESNQSRYLQ